MNKPHPPLSAGWTAEERIRVVLAILPGLSDDIYAGKYSVPGRPNITSITHILVGTADELESVRDDIEKIVADFEEKYPRS